MAARSKAPVCSRTFIGIAYSNPAGAMVISVVSIVCFVRYVSATGLLLFQRSLTECGVSECRRNFNDEAYAH